MINRNQIFILVKKKNRFDFISNIEEIFQNDDKIFSNNENNNQLNIYSKLLN